MVFLTTKTIILFSRYKIVLGSAFTEKFLSIGDDNGSGADHCELVGGYQTEAIMANDHTSAPTVTGTLRHEVPFYEEIKEIYCKK